MTTHSRRRRHAPELDTAAAPAGEAEGPRHKSSQGREERPALEQSGDLPHLFVDSLEGFALYKSVVRTNMVTTFAGLSGQPESRIVARLSMPLSGILELYAELADFIRYLEETNVIEKAGERDDEQKGG